MRTVLNKRNEINEGLLSRGADMVYAIRFLKLLVMVIEQKYQLKLMTKDRHLQYFIDWYLMLKN